MCVCGSSGVGWWYIIIIHLFLRAICSNKLFVSSG